MIKIVVPFFISLVLLVAFVACDDRDDNLTGPNIRIQNLSSQNFSRVEVRADTLFLRIFLPMGFLTIWNLMWPINKIRCV